MRIKFRYDSRDYHAYQKFGQTFPGADLDTPQNFDDPAIQAKIQPIGNVECTVYTVEYIAQNKTKKEYDIDEFFSRIPHTSQGADPRDVLSEVVKKGLLIKGTTIYDKPFSSYWRADTGVMDAFDNVRSSMLLCQSPIAVATYWYREWLNLQPNSVMSIGKTPISGHMYANEGWQFGNITSVNVKGEPMFLIEYWGGQTLLMPRATFNAAMKPLGMQTWVLSTTEIDAKRIKSLTEKIIDLMMNLIIRLRDAIKLYNVKPVV